MQAALELFESRPPARTRILSRLDRTRAVCAPDARIIAVMEWIVR
jgi:hypothetical protein